jgi:hypothetical protein
LKKLFIEGDIHGSSYSLRQQFIEAAIHRSSYSWNALIRVALHRKNNSLIRVFDEVSFLEVIQIPAFYHIYTHFTKYQKHNRQHHMPKSVSRSALALPEPEIQLVEVVVGVSQAN